MTDVGKRNRRDGFNRHGLSRHIDEDIARQVRTNSRFGCVICRSGFYTYEHIEPLFAEALAHDPEAMCCLCGSCQHRVSTGKLSKSAVRAAYARIRATPLSEVEPPSGPIDFHDGTAYLKIGGIEYPPQVKTVLRYHGEDIIRVQPGQGDKAGSIFAIFTDDEGRETLRIDDNAWIGSPLSWDIRTSGPRLTVRRGRGDIVLKLRLDPPGRIVIERLDMRFRKAHLLVTEDTYAIGRYIDEGAYLAWVHAAISVGGGRPESAVFEYLSEPEIAARDQLFQNRGRSMATANRSHVIGGALGVSWLPGQMVVASQCGLFHIGTLATGIHRLRDMRHAVFKRPARDLPEFIATKSVGLKELFASAGLTYTGPPPLPPKLENR